MPRLPLAALLRAFVALLSLGLAAARADFAPYTGSRVAALSASASHGDAAFSAALTSRSTPAAIALPGGATWTGTLRVPALPVGGMFTFGLDRAGYTASAEISVNSTNGADGTWQPLPVPLWLPEETGNLRLQKLDIPASASPVWIRLRLPNPSATSSTNLTDFELHAYDPAGKDDIWIALGASITRTSTYHALFKAKVRELYGPHYDPVLFNLATGGSTTYTWTGASPTLVEQALALHPRARFVFVHIGGNNVTNIRPYDPATDSRDVIIGTHLDSIYRTVINAGRVLLPARLSFRDYKTTPLVNAGANPENGSLPYNVSVIDPLIANLAPHAYDGAAGRGRVDPYTFLLNRQHYLDSDGIHLTSSGRVAWTTEMLAPMAGAIVYPPPTSSITAQPASVAAFAGSTARFSVTTNASSPTYQWYRNGVPLSGATSATLTLADISAADAGYYEVVVSASGRDIASDRATLTLADSTATRTIWVDLGSTSFPTPSPDSTGRRWNNLTASTAGSSLSPLVFADGAAHPSASLAVAASFSGPNTSGPATTTTEPAEARRDSFYVTGTGTSGNQRTGRLRFTGLDTSARYTLTAYASRSAASSRFTRFTLTGLAPAFLQAADNTANTAVLGSVAPAADGSLEIAVEPYDSAGVLQEYGYLNWLALTETLPLASPYAVWTSVRALPSASADATADPDGDGLPNLLEYAFDTDPLARNAPPEVVAAPATGLLSITFTRVRSELRYEVQGSSDLAAWTTLATDPGVPGDTVTISDTVSAPRRFLRVRVTRP